MPSETRFAKTLALARGWGMRRYLMAVLAGGGWLVVSGVPTGILETPFYVRMTPVEWWNYPFWLASAVLVGLLVATYVSYSGAGSAPGSESKAIGGGLFSVFAIGCPVCNKLVVLALGSGGAMTYFAPVQPVLGFLSVGLLLYALRVRLAGQRACAVPTDAGFDALRGPTCTRASEGNDAP
ncbi:hypothetical protein [Rubrobacter marinus]|uniref:hypothetical protein n=1 Tax=Rubrobacter marinus TaxID=2653852 RepID=UPI001A9FAAB2|nr:hypothetical protein [Rubrobacter marinus]